jgi:hypothetical protein
MRSKGRTSRKLYNAVMNVLSGRAVYPIPVAYTGPPPVCDAYKRVAEHPTESWLARHNAEHGKDEPGVE